MSSNRYYTILIVPEKTAQVKRLVVPSWILRSGAVCLALFSLIGIVMLLDYWYVMNQIGENKQLKLENRRLKQQVQVFKNKITTIESTMERVKTFATRLKVIMNIEDQGTLLQSLNDVKIPDASANIGFGQSPAPESPTAPQTGEAENRPPSLPAKTSPDSLSALEASPASLPMNPIERNDPEDQFLRQEYEQLDHRFSELNRQTLYVEQMLQDEYELLADQKSFISALPNRLPVVGYGTSGFGIRKSPYGGRKKMHEGIDIANRLGTPVKAPADGVVVFSNSKAGYGQTVILDHGYGLETWYGHTRKLLVTKGQKVKRGDTIALLGNSGRSTGPHLHYEVRIHGIPVDPSSYLLEN